MSGTYNKRLSVCPSVTYAGIDSTLMTVCESIWEGFKRDSGQLVSARDAATNPLYCCLSNSAMSFGVMRCLLVVFPSVVRPYTSSSTFFNTAQPYFSWPFSWSFPTWLSLIHFFVSLSSFTRRICSDRFNRIRLIQRCFLLLQAWLRQIFVATRGQSNLTKNASRGPIPRLGVTPGVEICTIEFLR